MLLHRAYSIHDALRPNRACYQTSASPKSRYGSQKLDASSAGYRQLHYAAKWQTAKPGLRPPCHFEKPSKTADNEALWPASPHTRVASIAAAAAVACHLWRVASVAWWHVVMWHTCKQRHSNRQHPQKTVNAMPAQGKTTAAQMHLAAALLLLAQSEV
jgi:hypothetical protein